MKKKSLPVTQFYNLRDNIPKEEELSSFFEIYDKCFINDSKEDKSIIQRNEIVFLGISSINETVIGGIIFEYFNHSNIILITYLFVSPEVRDEKYGRQILSDFKKYLLINSIFNQKKPTIFFEGQYVEINGNIEYSLIFKLMKNEKCQYIDFDYIEPISDKNNHKLCYFYPFEEHLRENVSLKRLKLFLKELYTTSKRSKIVEKEISKLEGFKNRFGDILLQIPKFIYPRLQFHKASVALHFVQEINKDTKSFLDDLISQQPFCRIFNSFENDLFALKYIENQPYFTKHIQIENAVLKFKNTFEFNSEGRHEKFILINEQRGILSSKELLKNVKIFVNFTYFNSSKEKENSENEDINYFNSNYLVWQIVIFPINFFNEYELIQLTKLYTGKQEQKTNEIPIIEVIHPNGSFQIEDFCKNLIGNSLQSLNITKCIDLKENISKIAAGTVQIDTNFINYNIIKSENKVISPGNVRKRNEINIDKKWYWSDIFQYFNAESKKDEFGFDKLDVIYSNKNFENARYILNTFCGISLGIFDFDRMSFEEVSDTISPLMTTDTYFVQLNKNAINCFCFDNKIYQTSLEQGIGINPYLIIPNSVLAYNGYLTDKIIEVTDFNAKTLSEYKNQIDYLQAYENRLIRNVFQYETEYILYNEGMTKRGILEKKEELKVSLEILKTGKEKLNEERNLYLTSIALALSIISLTQVYDFVDGLYKPENKLSIQLNNVNTQNSSFIESYAASIVTIFTLIIFIFLFYMAVNKPEESVLITVKRRMKAIFSSLLKL